VDEDRSEHEFKRIRLHHTVEQKRAFVAQYERGLAFAREAIEEARYEIGRLDERLGARE
jgi:hypothetical protein